MRRTPNVLGIVALVLCALGVLIFFEVVRPFRDNAIDGPIAFSSWAVGAALGISCFFLKGRSMALNIISVAANIIPLVAGWLLLRAIAHSTFIWH
jgi:hypothetical protein